MGIQEHKNFHLILFIALLLTRDESNVAQGVRPSIECHSLIPDIEQTGEIDQEPAEFAGRTTYIVLIRGTGSLCSLQKPLRVES